MKEKRALQEALWFTHTEAAPPFPCIPAQPPRQVGLSMIGWSLYPLGWDSVKGGDWYRFYHYYLSFLLNAYYMPGPGLNALHI